MKYLTPSQVAEIRQNHVASYRKLAKEYGVSYSTISNIKKGITHVNSEVCPTCGRGFADESVDL